MAKNPEPTRTALPPSSYDPYPLDLGTLVRLFVVGLFAGAAGWLLYLAISKYLVEPVFCSAPETFGICNNGGTIAWVVAHIIVMTVVVAVLARMTVYRPLLAALGTLVALWATHAWLGGLVWYMGALWQALLFGLAIALFGWIAKTSSFLVALILTIVLAVAARLVLLTA